MIGAKMNVPKPDPATAIPTQFSIIHIIMRKSIKLQINCRDSFVTMKMGAKKSGDISILPVAKERSFSKYVVTLTIACE